MAWIMNHVFRRLFTVCKEKYVIGKDSHFWPAVSYQHERYSPYPLQIFQFQLKHVQLLPRAVSPKLFRFAASAFMPKALPDFPR